MTAYLDEIKKVSNQPVKFLIYSHAHYDHIAGGKPFKEQGARIIAHKNAKAQFEWLAGALLTRSSSRMKWSTTRRPSRSAARHSS